MRSLTQNYLSVEYPDYFVLQQDRNIVAATCTTTFNSLELIVAIGGRTLQYRSTCSKVVIDVSELLRMVSGSTSISLTINRRYISGSSSSREQVETFAVSDSCYCANGRTLPDWFPCTGRKIYVPSGIGSVEIPLKGVAQVNGETYMIGGIVTRTVRNSGVINVVYTETGVQVGRPWDETDGETAFSVEVVDCMYDDGCFVEWIDSDGCKRYAPARMVSDSSGATGTQFSRYDGATPIASRHVESVKRTVTVSLTNIAPEVRLSDLTFSPIVRITDGISGMQVTPAFESVEVEANKNKSYILTFNVL